MANALLQQLAGFRGQSESWHISAGVVVINAVPLAAGVRSADPAPRGVEMSQSRKILAPRWDQRSEASEDRAGTRHAKHSGARLMGDTEAHDAHAPVL